MKIELLNASSLTLGMSSYQERQLLCGLPRPAGRLWRATTKGTAQSAPGVHNQPAKAGRMPQEHRPSTVDNLCCCCCCFFHTLMSAILSWKLSISENIVLYNCALKHPKTIHLSTPLCKGHNCSTVQHNFIYDGHVNPSFSQSATQPAIQSASRSAVQP